MFWPRRCSSLCSVRGSGIALPELGIAVRLEYSQAEVFHYLIWNVKWMPAFAKLVSELIIVQRKKTQISTSKVILTPRKGELFSPS